MASPRYWPEYPEASALAVDLGEMNAGFRGGFYIYVFGGFLKWWYPTTIGFPTKNDHFGLFWGYHHLRKHPCVYIYIHITTLEGENTGPLEEEHDLNQTIIFSVSAFLGA